MENENQKGSQKPEMPADHKSFPFSDSPPDHAAHQPRQEAPPPSHAAPPPSQVDHQPGQEAPPPEPDHEIVWNIRQSIKHNYHRRASWHNYDEAGTYMITIAVEGRKQLLGEVIAGDQPWVKYSELGKHIYNSEIPKITYHYPQIAVWLCCIMPDHIHFILNVARNLPPKKHLGHVIGAFKGGCSRAWWKMCGYNDENDKKPLFEDGYNDGILFDADQLQKWKKYLKDNPRRLALKRTNPNLFRVWHGVKIGEWECQMIGNVFLLDIPIIKAVIVHRADSDEVFESKFKEWMTCGEMGGVLVSASIAKREKMVMREALNRGYRVIVLRENGFHRYYKPGGESFDACVQGRMLQICPWDYHFDKHSISRSQCLELNTLALSISKGR